MGLVAYKSKTHLFFNFNKQTLSCLKFNNTITYIIYPSHLIELKFNKSIVLVQICIALGFYDNIEVNLR